MSKHGTVKQQPLYGCINCYELQSQPAGDLAVYDGECWCYECWVDNKSDETGIEYDELPEFEPDHPRPAPDVVGQEQHQSAWPNVADEGMLRAMLGWRESDPSEGLSGEMAMMDCIYHALFSYMRGAPVGDSTAQLVETLRSQLAEAQTNDRTAMEYLADVRLDKQCRDAVASALDLPRGGDFAWSYLLQQIKDSINVATHQQPAPDVAALVEALQADCNQQRDMKVKAREQRDAVTAQLKALQDECEKLVQALIASAKAKSAAEAGLIVDEAIAAYRKQGGEVSNMSNKSTNFTASNGEYRNPFYQGTFEDETTEQMVRRLHWAAAAVEAERVVQNNKTASQPAPDVPVLVGALVGALEMAREFIVNGIALGYIQMPDGDLDDPAHGTAPAIEAVLAAYRNGGEGA